MQSKLAMWSTEDKGRKFDRLLRLIADRTWLTEAARITLASSGARTPGVDGVDKITMEGNLHNELETIRVELLAGSYMPLPARRVYIPKANGKLRPLGIPSLRDRIVQRAMLMAMEPIWESDFHRASYGFRPARSVHHAIRTVKLQLQDGDDHSTAGRWVIEGDLASYFDTVHHRLLLKGVRKRIADRRFLTLLWRFIKAGCVDRGLFRAASEGVPQGGVITPRTQKVNFSLSV
jgi:RNA-directed DNA polymerase